MGGGKIFTKRKRFLHSSLLSRKEDVFGGESSFQGRKTWKKFFRPTSWLHFLRNEGDPETPPFFHRGRVKKKKERKEEEEEKRYIRNVKSFFYTFSLVICPHCSKKQKGKKRLKEERLRSISSFHYTPSDRILKETYPIVYSLLSRA